MVSSCDNSMTKQCPEIAGFASEPHLWHASVSPLVLCSQCSHQGSAHRSTGSAKKGLERKFKSYYSNMKQNNPTELLAFPKFEI